MIRLIIIICLIGAGIWYSTTQPKGALLQTAISEPNTVIQTATTPQPRPEKQPPRENRITEPYRLLSIRTQVHSIQLDTRKNISLTSSLRNLPSINASLTAPSFKFDLGAFVSSLQLFGERVNSDTLVDLIIDANNETESTIETTADVLDTETVVNNQLSTTNTRRIPVGLKISCKLLPKDGRLFITRRFELSEQVPGSTSIKRSVVTSVSPATEAPVVTLSLTRSRQRTTLSFFDFSLGKEPSATTLIITQVPLASDPDPAGIQFASLASPLEEISPPKEGEIVPKNDSTLPQAEESDRIRGEGNSGTNEASGDKGGAEKPSQRPRVNFLKKEIFLPQNLTPANEPEKPTSNEGS